MVSSALDECISHYLCGERTLEQKLSSIREDIASKFQKAMDTFQDVSEEDGDQDYLKLFSFICELSFDVYMKMQMIESSLSVDFYLFLHL